MNESALSFSTDVIQVIPEPICLYLGGPDIIIANGHWKKLFGSTDRLGDLERIGFDTGLLQDCISRARETESLVSLNPTSSDGTLRNLAISAVAGRSDVYVFTMQDQTEVKRVEQLRKDFIANVSHELRTPLTAVKGYIETLLDPQFLTIERVKQFLPVIFEHTERLHNLMLDLLSLSRLENPATHIELSPIGLSEHVQDAINAVSPLARMKNVEVDFQPADGVELTVLANPEHIERILVNLLDNAIKYSDRNERVLVWMERKGDFAWTHVKDDGPGIAPEELGRVFERFYRTKSASSGRARGSGLGLAIVKHIVQQLGGDIRVSSRQGEGSHFMFSLRVAGENPEDAKKVLGHHLGRNDTGRVSRQDTQPVRPAG